jgi:hypothetical protein
MDVKIIVKYLYENRTSIKYSVLNVFKLICFIIFVYQIILLTIDYLSFSHSVKLDIIDEKQVLPAITICSENYFSKESINTYFNITDEVSKQEKQNNTLFYKKYLKILSEFSADKLSLTISAKNLFNCSAKLHDFKTLQRKLLSDCEQYMKVIESLYNQYLGKCFTYFGDISIDRKSNIFFNNDFVQFEIKPNLIAKDSELQNSQELFYHVFIHSPRISILQLNEEIETQRHSFNEFRIRMTRINFLSWPYEHNCFQYSGIISFI